MVMRSIKTLSSVPLFTDLDGKELEAIGKVAVLQRYAANGVVFLQGDPCIGLYIVQEGWLKGFIASPSGREQIVCLLTPGDVFNEIGLLTEARNQVTVQALEDSAVWFFERGRMLRLVEEHPRLCRVVARSLAEHMPHLMKLVEDLSLRTVKSRLARILLENARGDVINRRRWMTQTEMAARLGTVLDVANRALNSLESEGIISVKRSEIRILQRRRLEELAEWEE